jgi:uncharacterized membrane protein
MSHTLTNFHDQPEVIAHIEDIDTGHIRQWLSMGWNDVKRAPAVSIGYGALIVVASYLITLGIVYQGAFFLMLPALGGFFLVAPALGIALYEVSRRLEKDETPQFWQVLSAWQRNSFHILTMGAVLAVAYVIWLMAANLIFAILYTGITPTFENFLPSLLTLGNLPMLLDRDIDLFSAMQASVAAVFYNWRPMLLWAITIVFCILAGMLTLYVGFAIIFPVVAHATWHAYRDIVKP